MCPLCIISAIVLGTSAASAGGVNWLKAKLGGEKRNRSGELCRLFPQDGSQAPERRIETESATEG